MRRLAVAALALCSLFVALPDAEARIRGGVRVGEYTDADETFVGGEIVVPLTQRLYFNPNVEWVFVDKATFLTGNFDLHYDWPVGPHAYVWLGGGLAYLYVDPDGPIESHDDWGANLLAGFGVRLGRNPSVLPYVQIKLILADDDYDEFVAALGIRF